jgi:hypothetical protein
MATQAIASAKETDWTKPAAMAIPKEGYFKLQNGRYGPVYPRSSACYGFTIIAKIKPGREEVIREYGKTICYATKPIVSIQSEHHLESLGHQFFERHDRQQ